MSDTDLELLARYTRHHAEDAFAELVRRHLDLVHSAALRQVCSLQLAEEVAQSTFLKLAGHARQLAPDTILTAWLYQVARHESIDVVRRETRRQLREQIATEMNTMNATAADWTHIEPLLDEAMHALDDTDRAAVLLRYFENKSLREVGANLGTSENAAQKRLTRAIEHLREFFAKRGVTIGGSGLAVVISTNAVQAAPVGLAVTISTAAALAGTAVITATATASKAIAMTTLQKTLVATAFVAAVGTGLYEAREASALRRQVKTLQQQEAPGAELDRLRAETERLTARLQANAGELESLRNGRDELLRLRGQVGVLRQELAQTKQRATRVSAQTNELATTWAVGEIKPQGTWKDAGLASPLAAVETFWWAAANNNVERMKQCIVFDRATHDEQVPDLYAKRETQSNGGLVQSLEGVGVRLLSHSFRWLDSDRTKIEVAVIGERIQPDGTMAQVTDGQELQLLRINGEWKVIRDEKRVKLSVYDDDSEAIAKLMMQMDSKTLEQLKADPRLPTRTLRAYEELKAKGTQ